MKPILQTASLLAIVMSATASAAPGVDDILNAYHSAVGKIPTTGGAEIDYAAAGFGLTGWRKVMFDLATGAFVSVEQADIVGEAQGFDGKIPWQRDTSGADTPQEGGDRIPVAISEAYRLA